jgi:hypothetical protein
VDLVIVAAACGSEPAVGRNRISKHDVFVNLMGRQLIACCHIPDTITARMTLPTG